MKRKSLLIICVFFVSTIFANEWKIQEINNDSNYLYSITDTPEGFEYLINTYVFCGEDYFYRNVFPIPLKDKIYSYLKDGNFSIIKEDGYDSIFLPWEFLDSEIEVNKEILKFIWKNLSRRYAGYFDMRKKGFNKKEFFKVKTNLELRKLLDKYVEDCHFGIEHINFTYRQKPARDEGTRQSIDDVDTYFEKETSNAYYVRFLKCSGESYYNEFVKIGEKGINKKFIIIDARSNIGGYDDVQFKVCRYLEKNNYQGTVLVLQDNWSGSSGECWAIFGRDVYTFKKLLIGTHSGGFQNFGNNSYVRNSKLKIEMFYGISKLTYYLPSNYLGEGKGYEPDIWATTETMASVLTGLGVDVTGIEFK